MKHGLIFMNDIQEVVPFLNHLVTVTARETFSVDLWHLTAVTKRIVRTWRVLFTRKRQRIGGKMNFDQSFYYFSVIKCQESFLCVATQVSWKMFYVVEICWGCPLGILPELPRRKCCWHWIPPRCADYQHSQKSQNHHDVQLLHKKLSDLVMDIW